MKRLINYSIAFLSIYMAILIILNLFAFPINPGRLLLYIFILIPLILISIDLGFNESLSKKIDKHLSYKSSILVQSLIIIIVFFIVMIWSINYANMLVKTSTRYYIGKIYIIDIDSMYMAIIPIVIYVVYYYISYLYKHILSKKTCNK